MLRLWHTGGFLFTGIAGVILHFLYDWTDESIVAAVFSAVNESIWEHMKLLFVPLFIFALIEYRFIGKDYENFWFAELLGTISGLVLIPVIYYSYTGIFGINADWFNILIYFIAAASAVYIKHLLLVSEKELCKSPFKAFGILCVIALIFTILTFIQPKIPLFADPVTGSYGI